MELGINSFVRISPMSYAALVTVSVTPGVAVIAAAIAVIGAACVVAAKAALT